MLHKINMLFVFFLPLFLVGEVYSQKIDIFHPVKNQVFADSVKISWNKFEDAENYKLYISKGLNFSKPDSFIVHNSNYHVYSPNQYVNEVYYFYVSTSINGTDFSSDTFDFVFFNPKNIQGLALWVSSDIGVDTLNGSVLQWNDRSGNGNHLNISNPSKQPKFVQNGLNNLPSIFFDDIDDGLASPVVLDSTDFLMTVLYSCIDSSTIIRRTIDGNISNWLAGKYGSSYNVFAGSFTGGMPYIPYAYMLQSVKQIGDTLENFLYSDFYGSTKPTYYPGQVGLGAWSGTGKTNGNINEWLVYDTTIKDSIRVLIEKYVMDKYAPPINLGADIKTCTFPIQIDASRDYLKNFLWSDNSTLGYLTVDSAGTYAVTSTDIFGRTYTDSVKVILDSSDFPVVLPGDTIICTGDILMINAGPDHFSYSWNISSTSASLSIDSAGTYIVSRTNCLANTSIDTIQVKMNLPEFTLGHDTLICFNASLILEPDSNFNSNVSYSWSTGHSSSAIPIDSTGVYYLEVKDEASCKFSDSIYVELDSALIAVDLGEDTSLCAGNSIGLLSSNNNVISYSWSTGSVDSSIVVDSSQTYVLLVNSDNCSYTDSISITIKGLAPVVDFGFDELCFGDLVQFTDSSVSLDQSNIIKWNWDFSDGHTSQLQNPQFEFDSIGLKNVVLSVETDSGCVTTEEKQLAIFPKPQAAFGNDLPCEQSPILFSDSSRIESGRIDSYLWFFGNNTADSSENPIFQYDDYGLLDISLIVVSDHGCMDTVRKSINVHPLPKSKIDPLGTCFGDSTYFIADGIIENGSVEKFEWNFGNGTNAIGTEVSTYYYQPGKYSIYLKSTSDQGCSALLKDSLYINELPIADFRNIQFCEDQPITLVSNSSAKSDSLTYFRYIFNDSDTSFQKNPVFPSAAAGTYNIKLLVKSNSACVDSAEKSISVLPKPIANFSLIKNLASVNAPIEIINLSQNSDTYLWEFGNGDTDASEEPIYSYTDTGSFNIQLHAFNSLGCRDSSSLPIEVYPAFLDASIDEIIYEQSGGFIDLFATISNTGLNTIETIEVKLNFGNGTRVKKLINRTILTGEHVEIKIDGSIQFVDLPSFICMEINKVNNRTDELQINNKKCVAGPESSFSLNISPNPVRNTLKLEMVLPSDGNLEFFVLNSKGSEIEKVTDNYLSKGYHSFDINMQNFPTGAYLFQVKFNNQTITEKIIKH